MAIIQLHIGALLGFVLATVVSRRTKLSEGKVMQQIDRVVVGAHYIGAMFSSKVMLLVFILGVAFLAERVLAYGEFNLRGMRDLYLQNDISPLAYIGTHLYMIMCALTAMRGAIDAVLGVGIRQLLLLIIAATPLGLGNAGRIFLLQLILIYFAPFLVARVLLPRRFRPAFTRDLKVLTLLLSLCLAIFALMGHLRERPDEEIAFFNPLREVLSWPASSLSALESWMKLGEVLKPTRGALTFEFFTRNLEKFRLASFEEERLAIDQATQGMRMAGDTASVIPKTTIPELALDFGGSSVSMVFCAIAMLLQYLSLRARHHGLIGLLVASMSLLGCALTTQGTPFRPDLCLVIVWASVLSVFAHDVRGKLGKRKRALLSSFNSLLRVVV